MIRRILSLWVLAAVGVAAPVENPSLGAARLNNLGAAYMNQQLFEKAQRAFEDAARLDSKLTIARLNQGIALLNLAKIEPAKQILEAAVQRDPKDPHAWYNLGLLYKNSDNPQSTIDAFLKVTELDPNDADTWYFLGAAYAQGKQYQQAIEAFQNALKLNPLHASAQFGMSRAYQQSGDTSSAREHLVRFQYITQNKLGTPISLAYGEQGKYSLVEESVAVVEKVPAAIPVRFVDVTAAARLVSAPASEELGIGSGACFLDYDGDGRTDIFLSNNGAQGGMSLYHNLGSGKIQDVTKKAGIDSSVHGVGCTAGDYDNDGATDLAVSRGGAVVLLHNEKNGMFRDVTVAAGVKSDGLDLGVTFIDYDHDGDLDLYVTQQTGPSNQFSKPSAMPVAVALLQGKSTMWRNNGNATFSDVTGQVGLSISGRLGVGAVGSDYDNDRAVDLVVAGSGMLHALDPHAAPAPVTIYRNPREGQFLESGVAWPDAPSAGAVGVAVLDFDHDGWMDIAFTLDGVPGIALGRNNKGKSFDKVPLPETGWARGFGVATLDYDNDGWVDLAAVGETAEGKGEMRLFRNLGPDGFKDVTADVGLDKITLKDPRALITADYDGDGATDLLITQNGGPAVLLRNEGGNKNHWLRLSLKGLADNKSAIGAKIEVFAGANRQKFEIAGSSGYLGQNSTDIVVGLGKATKADIVRMLWPTGVLQDEIDVAGNREQKFTEIDRRGSSCPTLFVWDGSHYQLVGDMLGAGVVGHWVAPGQRNIARPTEYIKIDRDVIREKENLRPVAAEDAATRTGHPRSGMLSFRFMEPLEEVVYLDQVQLLAVDHPAAFDVYPNEYFASNPPYPAFKVVASRDARPPAGARDEHGHDVLPDLLAHRYFGDFELLPFHGFAKMHSLELDLGGPYRGGPLWLLMNGEIEYFTATSMYAADQAGLQPVSPYVEALGADGKWTRVIDDMGFPAGGVRTMTADLTGKLPEGTQHIRISTNLQIYWDSILIDRTSQDQMVRLTPVPLVRADLGFHGFPLKIEGKPPGNVEYIYEKASATGPYTRPTGTYTRYGDVLPLLTSFDDQLAVFASGDEVALDFDPASLPTLPRGWVRDYFYAANGYEKDMDFYAFDGDRVDPLPFRAMGTYPYAGKTFPVDDLHLRYLLEYNTRHVSGNEAGGYSYDYPAGKGKSF